MYVDDTRTHYLGIADYSLVLNLWFSLFFFSFFSLLFFLSFFLSLAYRIV